MTYQSFHDLLVADTVYPYTYNIPPFWTEEYLEWEKQTRAKGRIENHWVTLHGGKVSGRLIAGNLNTMKGIWGSDYLPDIKPGDILMVEDADKTASIVEKNFSLLKVNGIFDRIGGLILGKHAGFDDQGTGRTPSEILQEVMGKVPFPVLTEFDCAHTHPMLTLPIGMQVELDSQTQTLRLL
ncbi:muramoyltetrapeptide carboxypeptidase LdcA involved in peptidoglycan recycling [Pullulanibacillus pueri]|nr:muramoyltetrapeptide carboxypeptidase LdcA involved in peptidoglycan recycling [Pullulanibacillus pueri]